MSKAVKGMVIDDIGQRMGDARDMLVVDASKLGAFAANRWRLDLRKKNITALTVRNTLARRALERSGVKGLDEILEGPSTLLFGGRDIVELSKEIVEAAKKDEKIRIKGGTVEGSALDAAGVDSLSKSPSREELIAKIASQILAPGANLAAALLGPGSTIASQLKTISDKEDNGSGEAATESA
ncbi:MAG: 50S ribosomal protein L10 [Planctomycetota bacterium]|nr:50S ribosomal protein L10 [Planctomycetaceae bacterium]MDQ3331314.1 50S ribosomal protein L10 [Planctomycetota bacterium]